MPYAEYHRKQKEQERYQKIKESGNYKYQKKGWNPNSLGKRVETGQMGNNSIAWKGGVCSTYRNYARQIMEKNLNRKLLKTEIVHHMDHNFRNNNIDNLYLFSSIGAHISYHHQKEKMMREFLCEVTV